MPVKVSAMVIPSLTVPNIPSSLKSAVIFALVSQRLYPLAQSNSCGDVSSVSFKASNEMASTAETVKLAVFGPTAVLAVLHFSMNVTPADENVNLVVMSISVVGFIFAP